MFFLLFFLSRAPNSLSVFSAELSVTALLLLLLLLLLMNFSPHFGSRVDQCWRNHYFIDRSFQYIEKSIVIKTLQAATKKQIKGACAAWKKLPTGQKFALHLQSF